MFKEKIIINSENNIKTSLGKQKQTVTSRQSTKIF